MQNKPSAWKAEIELSDDAKPLCFPHGMIGFPEAKQYVVLNSGGGNIVCFQSLEQTEASFLMTPWDEKRLGPPPTLTPDQRAALQCASARNLLWMVVLNPFADREWVLANLQAPVALNQETGLGVQCIQANPNLALRFRWMPQPSKAAKAA